MVDTGDWYHFALVRDGDTNKIYVNGQLEHTNLSSSNGSISSQNPNLLVGVRRTLNSGFFHGSIDDLVIYDCALSDSEVEELFNLTPIGINEGNGLKDIAVFPNPMITGTTIQFGESNSDVSAIQLVDIMGKVVRAIRANGSSTVYIPRKSLSSGVYQVVLMSTDRIVGSIPLVVQ